MSVNAFKRLSSRILLIINGGWKRVRKSGAIERMPVGKGVRRLEFSGRIRGGRRGRDDTLVLRIRMYDRLGRTLEGWIGLDGKAVQHPDVNPLIHRAGERFRFTLNLPSGATQIGWSLRHRVRSDPSRYFYRDIDIQPTAAPVVMARKPKPDRGMGLAIRAEANPLWRAMHSSQKLTMARKPFRNAGAPVLVMGDYSAERMGVYMGSGTTVLPRYGEVPVSEAWSLDRLQDRAHINHLTTHDLRREFERYAGYWTQGPTEFWTEESEGGMTYRDPYRRLMLARSLEDLGLARAAVEAVIDKGIDEAGVFVFCIGETEIFRDEDGRVVTYTHGHGSGEGLQVARSRHSDNLENLARVVEIINARRPGAQIVVAVSPVRMDRTFLEKDVLTADSDAKAVLRAAMGSLARRYENVTYFPLLEITQTAGRETWYKGGRHPNPWVYQKAARSLVVAHLTPAAIEDAVDVAPDGASEVHAATADMLDSGEVASAPEAAADTPPDADMLDAGEAATLERQP